MPSLRAGWAKTEITPPTGYPMAGYVRRTGSSTGVLDPLYARALVLEDGGCTVVFIIADLLLFSRRWARRLRAIAARSVGAPASNIIVAATHTHSGPLIDTSPFDVASPTSPPPQPGFQRSLEQRIEAVVQEAALRMNSVKAAMARVIIQGVASDRNRPTKSRSQPLYLLRLSACDTTALFGVYACHSTVLGYKNTLFSGDLLGRLTQLLEPAGGFALMGCGAAANISTRFTRRNQSLGELERLSRMAADQVRCAVYKPLDVASLSIREAVMDLTLRRLSRKLVHNSGTAGRIAEAAEEALENITSLKRLRRLWGTRAAFTLTQVRLGEISWLAIPFEIGFETGEFLWNQSQLIPLCYANGYGGYIAPAGASPFTYEVLSSPYSRRADLQLRRMALRLASYP
ncbi:MAG TPA: neutral/alkaline non-lysosomal ceramidase N-terminal domain-containing protein [Terriglobia bacterium]|nr:neutral/alkaline non-lysosomal ceramidase N-terminal domain-containing protein [Terriglobia bacterium]